MSKGKAVGDILLERIKLDRVNAMKEKDQVTRQALEAVITELDTKRGRGTNITEAVIIAQLKSEIKILRDVNTIADNAEDKALVLEKYLPRQMSEQELVYELVELLSLKELSNPGQFIKHLNSLGLDGTYDKALAVKLFKELASN